MRQKCRKEDTDDYNMAHALSCGITQAKNTLRLSYTALPQQQWLHERALMLRHTNNTSLVQNYAQKQISYSLLEKEDVR